MSIIIVTVCLTLEMCRPILVDLEITIEVHVKTVGLFIQSILCRIFIMVILSTDKTMDIDTADFIFQAFDILRILVDLFFQCADLASILALELFKDGLIAVVQIIFLHSFGNDGGHLIARHGTAALESVVAHAVDDALFGEVIKCLIGPVIFRDIREAVRHRCEGRTRHADRQASEDGKYFLVDFHVIDFLSL